MVLVEGIRCLLFRKGFGLVIRKTLWGNLVNTGILVVECGIGSLGILRKVGVHSENGENKKLL